MTEYSSNRPTEEKPAPVRKTLAIKKHQEATDQKPETPKIEEKKDVD